MFEAHVETGFQLATFQGPLCAEPVEGVAYFLESLDIDSTGIEEEQSKCSEVGETPGLKMSQDTIEWLKLQGH